MSAKRSRLIRVGMESLERRDTPSTHALASSAATKTESVSGTGYALVRYSVPGVNGQTVDSVVAGTSKTLGKYSGTFNTFFNHHLSYGTGAGVITAANGDTINVSVKASIQSPNSGYKTLPGTMHLKVTGGTGTFANATGTGLVSGTGNVITASFKFTFHSRLKP